MIFIDRSVPRGVADAVKRMREAVLWLEDRFYKELLKRDKVNLDLFWLRDESLEDAGSLAEPDLIADEIAEDLQSALDQFAAIANDLKPDR